MNEQNSMNASLTLDLMRNRIRIHKATLHYLGDPAYIQFLVNPEELFIAVLGLDKPLPGGTANRVKISEKGKKNYQSVEFYSAILLNSLFAVTGPLDYRCNYYLTGEVDQINRVAYFSLKTLKAVERKRLNGRQGV